MILFVQGAGPVIIVCCLFVWCMRIYKPFLVSPNILYREACRGMQGITILFGVLCWFSFAVWEPSAILFSPCVKMVFVFVSFPNWHILILLYYIINVHYILKQYITSKGPLLLGQFSELDTSGYNSTSLLFSERQTKRRNSALPTRV